MLNGKFFLINLGIIIILLILIFYRFRNHTKKNNEIIKQQGWTLYLLESCPHCTTQLQDLTLFKEYIIFNKNGKIIKDNIKGKKKPFDEIPCFPFWFNNITNDCIEGVTDLKTIMAVLADDDNLNQ